MSEQSKKQMTYADAGVDIDAGNRAVELMKESVRATYRPEVTEIWAVWRFVCTEFMKISGTDSCFRD